MTRRAGVFVCHCGHNIAATVDVKRLADEMGKDDGVVFSKDYVYMCSDPGQKAIIEAVKEHKLDSVVVSCCTPSLHEKTFREASEAGGVNQFQCEIANIREQCAWVHKDRDEATAKALKITRSAVRRVSKNEPLTPVGVPVTRRTVVIGGGIAGIQTALDIANAGIEVVLVEKQATIGGHMLQLSETFPTLDCAQCILSPKMVEVSKHPKITLMVQSEVTSISGFVGNFKVKVHQKAQYVDPELCKLCDDCTPVCPTVTSNEYDAGLTGRRAIHIPFAQAIPASFYLDESACLGLNPVVCGKCKDACTYGAIDYDSQAEEHRDRGRRRGRRHGLRSLRRWQHGGVRARAVSGRDRRHPVRAHVLRVRPHGGPRVAAIRSQGAEERRLHPVLRLARSRAALHLLLEDLLHVHGQARLAVQASRP